MIQGLAKGTLDYRMLNSMVVEADNKPKPEFSLNEKQ